MDEIIQKAAVLELAKISISHGRSSPQTSNQISARFLDSLLFCIIGNRLGKFEEKKFVLLYTIASLLGTP